MRLGNLLILVRVLDHIRIGQPLFQFLESLLNLRKFLEQVSLPLSPGFHH